MIIIVYTGASILNSSSYMIEVVSINYKQHDTQFLVTLENIKNKYSISSSSTFNAAY